MTDSPSLFGAPEPEPALDAHGWPTCADCGRTCSLQLPDGRWLCDRHYADHKAEQNPEPDAETVDPEPCICGSTATHNRADCEAVAARRPDLFPETVDPDGRLADATNRATDYTLARVDLDTVDLDTLAEQISAAVLAHEDDCGCEFTVTPWPGVAYLHTQETGQ